MIDLCIRLLGRFNVRRNEQLLRGLDGQKTQELFSYLLLHRRRPHSREALADLLWPESSAEQSRKYLRQTLWHLQTAADAPIGPDCTRMLRVETE